MTKPRLADLISNARRHVEDVRQHINQLRVYPHLHEELAKMRIRLSTLESDLNAIASLAARNEPDKAVL